MERFYLERPSLERKQEALEYLQEHAYNGSDLNGTGGLKDCLKGITYEEWLDDVIKCQEKEYAESKNLVPGTTYFTIRKSDNKIVGMVNLRHYLNDYLKKYGGHIGYGIRPTERRKGYAKIQLYLTLIEVQKLGIEKVMIDCSVTNLGSDKTIKALGGILERCEIDPSDGELTNVYWINVNDSIEKYKDVYKQYISDSYNLEIKK